MEVPHLELIWIVLITLSTTFGITFSLNHCKNQRKREQELITEADDILIGTLADLEEAEKEVAEMDLEKKLIETHQLVETFDTMHGFDTNYIEALVRELAEKNINATYLFKVSMPTGTMSYTGQSGSFELFVNKEAVEETQQFIKDRLALKK